MKTFAHPIMLEDADLDYVTGGGISATNSTVQGNVGTFGDTSNSGNPVNSFNTVEEEEPPIKK